MKNRSYSLQRLSSIRTHINKKINPPSRLNFPKPGDSSIYAGVGRKHFNQEMCLNPQPLQHYLQKQSSHHKIEFKERQNSKNEQRKSSLPNQIYNNNKQTIINSPYTLQNKNQHIFRPSDSLQKMEAQYDLKKLPNKRQKLRSQAQQSPLKSNLKSNDVETLVQSAIYNNKNANIIKISKFQNKLINPTFLSNINL